MLAFECSNPLWGRTINPWNDRYTCGGSSGGEGAILAMDGSVIGLGSDIGGSLRIPASYCGIYSLKPTAGRISIFGCKGTDLSFWQPKIIAEHSPKRPQTWLRGYRCRSRSNGSVCYAFWSASSTSSNVKTFHRSVNDVERLCRLAFGASCAIQDYAPLPYRNVNLTTNLKFGYYTSGGLLNVLSHVELTVACRRHC